MSKQETLILKKIEIIDRAMADMSGLSPEQVNMFKAGRKELIIQLAEIQAAQATNQETKTAEPAQQPNAHDLTTRSSQPERVGDLIKKSGVIPSRVNAPTAEIHVSAGTIAAGAIPTVKTVKITWPDGKEKVLREGTVMTLFRSKIRELNNSKSARMGDLTPIRQHRRNIKTLAAAVAYYRAIRELIGREPELKDLGIRKGERFKVKLVEIVKEFSV